MSLSGIPPAALRAALALPENSHAAEALERALSHSKAPGPVGVGQGDGMAQRGREAPRQAQKRAGEMNLTEARYLREILEPCIRFGSVTWWGFEPVTFKLGKGVRYTPDFLVMHSTGMLSAVEVKGGYVREDADLKFKVAASMYPWLSWEMVQYVKGHWHTLRERPRVEITLTRIDP